MSTINLPISSDRAAFAAWIAEQDADTIRLAAVAFAAVQCVPDPADHDVLASAILSRAAVVCPGLLPLIEENLANRRRLGYVSRRAAQVPRAA